MTRLAFAAGNTTTATGGFASFIPLLVLLIVGYFFYKKVKMKAKDLPPIPKSNVNKGSNGWRIERILIVLSLIGLFFAFFMDTTVGFGTKRVNNIGLMNDKQNYIIISGVFLLIGVLLTVSNHLKNNKNEIVNASLPDDESKLCPYCAEKIKKEAVFCRFCRKTISDNSDNKSTDSSTTNNSSEITKNAKTNNDDRSKKQKKLIQDALQSIKLKDYKSAVVGLSAAINIEENNGELYYFRAVVYSKINDKNKSLMDLEQSAKLGYDKAIAKWEQIKA